MKYIIFSILLIIGLAGCQTFAGEDVPATLSYEMTAVATEAALIQQTVQIEQTDVVETLQASGTAVANASNVNQVLAATVRVNILPTSAMREVIDSEKTRLVKHARYMDELLLIWQTQKKHWALADYADLSVSDPVAAKILSNAILSLEREGQRSFSDYRSSPDGDAIICLFIDKWREEQKR